MDHHVVEVEFDARFGARKTVRQKDLPSSKNQKKKPSSTSKEHVSNHFTATASQRTLVDVKRDQPVRSKEDARGAGGGVGGERQKNRKKETRPDI